MNPTDLALLVILGLIGIIAGYALGGLCDPRTNHPDRSEPR